MKRRAVSPRAPGKRISDERVYAEELSTVMDQGGTRQRQISPHPRYKPRRRNAAPFLAAAGAVVVLGVLALLFVVAVHPWSSGASPTATPPATPPAIESSSPAESDATATPPETTPEPTPDAAATPTPASDRTFRVYIVQSGDTINKIAARFGITRAQLLAANPQITNPSRIYVGQRIFIP